MKGRDFVTEVTIALIPSTNLLYTDPNEVKGISAPQLLAKLFLN